MGEDGIARAAVTRDPALEPVDLPQLEQDLPLEDASLDGVICQEGIEHVPDQLRVLREFNRVLRPDGTLWLTTPSFSHLRARLARFLVGSDYWKRLAPSEVDSIWFSDGDDRKLYFGHLFLMEASQLETLAALSGFRVEQRLRTDLGNTSVVLALLLYPFLALATLASYLVYRGEESDVDPEARRAVLWQRVKLNLSLKTLCCKHLFWVLRKERELDEVHAHLRSLTDPLWKRG